MTADKALVLVVEDEPKIAEVLVQYLEREGYAAKVLGEGSGAVEWIENEQPTFVILDLMLPGKDGLTICREVRQFSDVPIMMLTAKIDEIDRLVGLELGADDYVCKPFSPREVVARIKTILRRLRQGQPVANDDELRYRDIILYPDKFKCMAGGEGIELTPVEFRLLQGLMSHPGRVFSRDRLMSLAYTDDRIISDRTIDTHIKNVRKKLSPALGEDDMIHSIYGVGYKIE